MTKLALLAYKCKRCNKLFWSYYDMVDDNDKKYVEKLYEKEANNGFADFIIRDERECRKCRKGVDLEQFMDLQEDFGMPSKT